MQRYWALSGLACTLLAAPAWAENTEGTPEEIPDALSFEKRDAWGSRTEMYVFGGSIGGDYINNSFLVGAQYLVYLTDAIALGPSFRYSYLSVPDVKGFDPELFVTDRNMYDLALSATFGMPAAFAVAGTVVDCTLYSEIGGGAINVNRNWQPSGFIGGGLKMFLGAPWFALRVGLRTSFQGMKLGTGETVFEQNISVGIGVSFMIPPLLNP